MLTAEQEAELLVALEGPVPDGEVWTGRQVAQWISQRARRPVTSYCGWLYLRRLDCRLRVTRTRHVKANPVEQEGFKKTARHRSAGTSRASRSAGAPVGV